LSIKIYTFVYNKGSKLFVRGIDENGERVTEEVDFSPTVWVKNTFNYSPWQKMGLIKSVSLNKFKEMIDDSPMTALTFNNIKDCNTFLKENTSISKGKEGEVYRDIENVYTAPRNIYESQYMCEFFPENVHVDLRKLKIYNYDIETEVGHRNVPDDTLVDIRLKKRDDAFFEQEVEYKTMTIAEFEAIPSREKWEAKNPETGEWTSYENHPYHYIGGFPDPSLANEKVTLITVKDVNDSHIFTWGVFPFENNREDVTYFHCKDEADLLRNFITWWHENTPDIMSGWNTSTFDNVYLANRTKKILGNDWMKGLSPFGEIKITKKKDLKTKNEVLECNWVGISNIDYLKLYKKFGSTSVEESYKLDAIAEKEVGIKKVENPTGGSFKDFYTGVFDVKTKPSDDAHEIRKLAYRRTQIKHDPSKREEYEALNEKIIQMCHQTFIEYNIRDVELVDKIDKKRKLIDLCIAIAYKAHENFDDAFMPVKTWDFVIYNYQWRRGIVIPIHKRHEKNGKFEGAYVKPPLVGKHEFCESFDLNSLYPHLLMQYNISPETLWTDSFGKPYRLNVSIDDLVNKRADTSYAKAEDVSLAASGYMFRKEKRGIIPTLCETFYNERKKHKKIYLKFKAEHEKIVNELRNRGEHN